MRIRKIEMGNGQTRSHMYESTKETRMFYDLCTSHSEPALIVSKKKKKKRKLHKTSKIYFEFICVTFYNEL